MRPRRLLVLSALFAALCSRCFGQQATPEFYSVPPADAPELAPRGSYSVGVRTLDLVNPQQIDVLHLDPKTGKAPLYDRPLKIEIWYPAVVPAGVEERTSYEAALFAPATPVPQPGAPKTFVTAGKALRDAKPVAGKSFPLVVVSHGYPGSRMFLTYLTENLASKGYVVAAIDHTDSVWGDVKPFPSTLFNRSSDQVFTIRALTGQASQPGNFLNGLVDTGNAAIVGYSMGGYGALASAGAGYSKSSILAKGLPAEYAEGLLAGTPKFAARSLPNLKAVVAISPWGGQPPYNSWDATGLAGIRIPSLFIVGDQDDVSGYDLGVKPAFAGAVNSDRCLLVYQNARHNVGGNPAPAEALGSFTTREFFEEPVWRKDRIDAINQHFITAFLDLYLKGDESRRAYLHPAVEKSNDGKWPQTPGANAGAKFSTGDPKDNQTVWKGFQRRWAVGLELHCMAPVK
jgi:predicted dienelactone hydrolase